MTHECDGRTDFIVTNAVLYNAVQAGHYTSVKKTVFVAQLAANETAFSLQSLKRTRAGVNHPKLLDWKGGQRAPLRCKRAPNGSERGVICSCKRKVTPRKREKLGKGAHKDKICALRPRQKIGENLCPFWGPRSGLHRH